MSSRLPLATLPLSPFIPHSTTSPSKARRLTPLKQPAESMSLLPSPFLQSTTPRAATSSGPLSTLYERARGGEPSPVSRSRNRTPSRLIEQEELQERLPGDEVAAATPPRRLLDLFVQSAERGTGSPSRSTAHRVSLASNEVPVDETPPEWNFYFDDGSDAVPPRTPSQPSESSQESQGQQIVEETSDEELPGDAPYKENVRLPPRRFRTSTSTSLLSLPAETVSAPASLPGSVNPSPTRPPPSPLSLPISVPPTSTDSAAEPPKTPDHVPHSPSYPTSYPPLNANTEVDANGGNGMFSEGSVGLFETKPDEPLNGLGLGVGLGQEDAAENRRGRKRMSEEAGVLLEESFLPEKRFKLDE